MKVLVACEYSGVVRDAFARRGHDSWSCDLLATESPGNHYVGDVRDILDDDWDLLIAHPPCTYLSVSGLHWNKRNPERIKKTEEALEFARLFFDSKIPKKCIENPVSCISSRIRKPDQIIQPYEFGHDASKRTCLWLERLKRLEINPDNRFPGRKVIYNNREYERWGNQTDSGQNKLGPSDDRWKLRSKTFEGIAEAMAEQWG